MLARVQDTAAERNLHRMSDAERLSVLQEAAEEVAERHARGDLTTEQAAEELKKIAASASNGFLRFFGL
jgi:uncharacterized membrane protein